MRPGRSVPQRVLSAKVEKHIIRLATDPSKLCLTRGSLRDPMTPAIIPIVAATAAMTIINHDIAPNVGDVDPRESEGVE